MKRLNIELSEDQYEFIKNQAKRKKTTIVGIIRQAINAMSKKPIDAYSYKNDPFYLMDASFKSQSGDLAFNHDKYLYGREK